MAKKPKPGGGIVRNLDIPYGRPKPPPGSLLKKPPKPKS